MRTEAAQVPLTINGRASVADAGDSVAVALLKQGTTCFRRSVDGEPRAPLCGMGICYECRVTIDGQPHQKSCQILVAPGMEVVTDA